MVAEYRNNGAMLRRYVHGSNAKADDPLLWYEGTSTASANARHLYADPRGSIAVVAGASGTTIAINTYDAYGIPGSANTGRFQYTGQMWIEALDMYYYKARIYSPTLGRFLQTDPIGYEDQVNLYAYVANDPINGVDPTGLVGEVEDWRGHDRECIACRKPWDDALLGDGDTDNTDNTDNQWNDATFVAWYFLSDGQDVTLKEIGLDAVFESHPDVQAKINGFVKMIMRKGQREVLQRDVVVTDVTDTIFSLGNSSFFRSAACGLNTCSFSFEIRDRFEDPLDTGFELPGGTPYAINHKFGFRMKRTFDR